jgi:hypothetical protein
LNQKQLLEEIHKELETNSRLCGLLTDYATAYASAALRRLYTTNDAAALIRQSGMAEGVEMFVADLTQRKR